MACTSEALLSIVNWSLLRLRRPLSKTAPIYVTLAPPIRPLCIDRPMRSFIFFPAFFDPLTFHNKKASSRLARFLSARNLARAILTLVSFVETMFLCCMTHRKGIGSACGPLLFAWANARVWFTLSAGWPKGLSFLSF